MTHRLPDHSRRRLARHAVLTAFSAVVVLLAWPGSVAAQPTSNGTSSRKAKQRTIDSLPYHQLTDQAKRKLSTVLKSPSFYRRLPPTAIQADPDYFQFLVRHPEVIVSVWQLMGITKMSCERTGDFSLKSNDGAGTISDLELIYGSQDLHIYYGHGTYEGSVLRRPLGGDCVLVLKTNYSPGPAGVPIANNVLDVFLKVDNATVSLVAKTLQPLIGPTADHNFVESVNFVQRLNETTRKNGPGVQQMAKRFQITEKVRRDFTAVAGNVYARANRASAATAIPPNARVSIQTRPDRTSMNTSPIRQYGHLAPRY